MTKQKKCELVIAAGAAGILKPMQAREALRKLGLKV